MSSRPCRLLISRKKKLSLSLDIQKMMHVGLMPASVSTEIKESAERDPVLRGQVHCHGYLRSPFSQVYPLCCLATKYNVRACRAQVSQTSYSPARWGVTLHTQGGWVVDNLAGPNREFQGSNRRQTISSGEWRPLQFNTKTNTSRPFNWSHSSFYHYHTILYEVKVEISLFFILSVYIDRTFTASVFLP